MADISKLEEQAQLLANSVSGWENKTVQRIGARIKKYGKLSLSDVKSINNIATVTAAEKKQIKEMADNSGLTISSFIRYLVAKERKEREK